MVSIGSKHKLVVVNPGHFHAALTLRERHALLSDEVYVYAEDGPELRDFLQLVASFNERKENPASWRMHVYRGEDYMDALLQRPPGDIAIVAGKNDTKLSTMQRLHRAGLHVLGDKTWITDAGQLATLNEITASPPLVMDIMTERFEVAARLQQALSANEALFGSYRNTDGEPAIQFSGVHHLYKEVNGKPLVRPAWYFDTAVQGEGITDITTHFVDLAQWFVGNESTSGDGADAVVTGARQWPTKIPLNMFSTITGLSEFPANVRCNVRDGVLEYLCNANIRFTLRGLPIEIDSVWNLAIPEDGGDTHYCILRGTRADLVVDQGPETGFETRLRVIPVDASGAFNNVLTRALSDLQSVFPGVNHEATGTAYEIVIPAAMRHGHEARFADVLNRFLEYVDSGTWPAELGPQLVAKYTLLANARELSHR